MTDFVESKPSALLTHAVQAMMPTYFRLCYANTHLKVTDATVAALDSLKNQPTLICPNHSHREDGEVIFWLSAALRMNFQILTAREIFETYGAPGKLILQRLGCYSVSRGKQDFRAVEFTERLLESQSAKVVLFPEGEISFNSADIGNLETGAVFMGLEASRHLLKAARPADVYLLPLAIRYQYLEDVSLACAAAVSKLERLLVLSSASGLTVRQRAMMIAKYTLLRIEARFNLSTDGDFDLRLQNALMALVTHYARRLNCHLPPVRLLNQIHVLQSSALELQRGEKTSIPLDEIQHELAKAVMLRAVSASCFSADAPDERFADAVTILEIYHFGYCSDKGVRTVTVDACEPLNLLNYIQDYNRSKAKTIRVLTDILASRLRRRLRQLN